MIHSCEVLEARVSGGAVHIRLRFNEGTPTEDEFTVSQSEGEWRAECEEVDADIAIAKNILRRLVVGRHILQHGGLPAQSLVSMNGKRATLDRRSATPVNHSVR